MCYTEDNYWRFIRQNKKIFLCRYNASLFGNVSGNIVVKNVIFDNLTINGKGATGALVSTLLENASATFENVTIQDLIIHQQL
ncbi:MAG: hypothetical protein E7354_01135 [Clostridiales bacterium]|nr:hypothetical protein [Clostridiales bacterium]